MFLKDNLKAFIDVLRVAILGKLLSYIWSGTSSLPEMEVQLKEPMSIFTISLATFLAFLSAVLSQCYASSAGTFYLGFFWQVATVDGIAYVATPIVTTIVTFGITLGCIWTCTHLINKWADHGPLVRWAWAGMFIAICLATTVMNLLTSYLGKYLGTKAHALFKIDTVGIVICVLVILILFVLIYWITLTRCYSRLMSLLPATLTQDQRSGVLFSVMLIPVLILASTMYISETVTEVRGDPALHRNRNAELAPVYMTGMTCMPSQDDIACVMNLWTGTPQDYSLIGSWISNIGVEWAPVLFDGRKIPVIKLTPMAQLDVEIHAPKKQVCKALKDNIEQAITFKAYGHENARSFEERRTISLVTANATTMYTLLSASCASVPA